MYNPVYIISPRDLKFHFDSGCVKNQFALEGAKRFDRQAYGVLKTYLEGQKDLCHEYFVTPDVMEALIAHVEALEPESPEEAEEFEHLRAQTVQDLRTIKNGIEDFAANPKGSEHAIDPKARRRYARLFAQAVVIKERDEAYDAGFQAENPPPPEAAGATLEA